LLKVKKFMSRYALALPSDAQQKSDREQDGLIGNVKTVWLKSLHASRVAWLFPIERSIPLRMTSYNVKGNKIKVVSYDPANPSNKQTELYSYDAAGRKIEWIVRQGAIIRKTVYRYDDEKNKIEALEQVIDDKNNIVTRNYVSIFDSQGNQIEAGCSDDSGAKVKAFYRYEFDDKGKVRVIETYNEDGFLYHKVVCSYDAGGQLEEKSFYGSNGTMYERMIFTYGADGRTEEKLTYKDDGLLDRRIIYHYDNKENLTEVAGYNANPSLLGRTSHAFHYDDVGNWIKKISQSWNVETAKPISQWTEHRIIYYAE
jgi:YD repeat-containing protein